jgi:hypothetical protein
MFIPAIFAIFGAFVFVFEALRHRRHSKKINLEINELKNLKNQIPKPENLNPQNIIKHKNGAININFPDQNPQKSNNLNKVGMAVGAAAAVGSAAYMANKVIRERNEKSNFKPPQIGSNTFNKPFKKGRRKKFLGLF